MKKYIYITLALTAFLFVSAGKSFACSCVVTPDPVNKQIENSFTGSEAVFSGEVLEIKESTANQYDYVVKLKVTKNWKGADQSEITITTGKQSAMCGFDFKVGQKYIVYASGSKDNLSTTNCSRTAAVGTKSDAKYLDKLKKKKVRV